MSNTSYPAAQDAFALLTSANVKDPAVLQQLNNLVDAITAMQARMGNDGDGIGSGRKFHVTKTITSAAAHTAINLVPDAQVGATQKVYLQGALFRVNGTTVWATTANVKIQDTNGTAVDFVTVLVALLTSQARVAAVPQANMTLEDAFSLGTGGTAGKGLQILGDANGTGSDLVVTAWGVIK